MMARATPGSARRGGRLIDGGLQLTVGTAIARGRGEP
jgi:hypothetical protein